MLSIQILPKLLIRFDIALINKLHSYGIHDQLILCIKDFLHHRSQRVKINYEFSAWYSVISGISQGSVL